MRWGVGVRLRLEATFPERTRPFHLPSWVTEATGGVLPSPTSLSGRWLSSDPLFCVREICGDLPLPLSQTSHPTSLHRRSVTDLVPDRVLIKYLLGWLLICLRVLFGRRCPISVCLLEYFDPLGPDPVGTGTPRTPLGSSCRDRSRLGDLCSPDSSGRR